MTETEYYLTMEDISHRVTASCDAAYQAGLKANKVKYDKAIALIRDFVHVLNMRLDVQHDSASHRYARELLKEIGE